MEMCETASNEARFNEAPQPVEIISANEDGGLVRRVALPPEWSLEERNDESFLQRPLRKKARVSTGDADSFVSYMKRHGSLTTSTIWCKESASSFEFTGIINDHGEEETKPAWRDHLVFFSPRESVEWKLWNNFNKKHFTQADFASFIEESLRDIASVDGCPTGSQMLEMALTFEANQDMRFKSAIRLQNGGVQMAFSQNDDAATLQRMQVFDRFSIGIPVFWNGEPYRIDVRLRYRVREGKLVFWYELIRPDKIFESASRTITTSIAEKSGLPMFFGEPFAGNQGK